MNTAEKEIRDRLFELQDTEYRDFHSRLMPTIDKELVIGVRMPQLRKLMKELKGTGLAEEFLQTLPHRYYEENNLHMLLIGQIPDYEECIDRLNTFLPYVDNWVTCDMSGPEVFKKHLPELLKEIAKWLASEETYTVRYGIGMLLRHYLDEAFDPEYLKKVAKIDSKEYYIKMMVAWYFATALAKQYDHALPYLEEHSLERWIHNKTIQKAVESYRITPEQKAYLKTLHQK